MSFTHLHRHSEYSVLDGMGTAEQYAARAKELGHSALALTDHGNLCGSLEHIAACEKVGLHPIVGMEAYFRPKRTEHEAANRKSYHLILLANGLKGWRSLKRLSSAAYLDDAYYHKPCIDYDLLERHSEGLICTTACIGSYLTEMLLTDGDVHGHMTHLQSIFKDNLFVEIMPHDFDKQRAANPKLIETAVKYGVTVIATTDAHYVLEEHADTAATVFKMSTQRTMSDDKAKRERGEEVYGECPTLFLMDEDEVRNLFHANHPTLDYTAHVDAAIRNTEYLVSKTEPFSLNKALKLPRIRAKRTAEEILLNWCWQGLGKIGEQGNPVYEDRMNYELGVLKAKDVLDYFVIVGEHVRWAKSEGIRVGPGRGSAAGCLVSYLIGITAVDPIVYGLLFERFLNPDRAGMPDIDIDFPADKVEYVRQKFIQRHGVDHVSNVISFQTFKAKGAFKDVSRVYEVPLNDVLRMTKRIDDNMTIDEALQVAEVQAFAQKHPEVIKHAQILEGMVKAFSKHASAVVVTEQPVTDYMPTMRARKDAPIVTAFSDKPSSPIISEYGILKIDFLSATALSVQQGALELIKERTGVVLDLDALPAMRDPDAVDEAAMKVFRDGHTFGILQFGGSRGITAMLRKMNPKSINDLAACNALYRPGPLDGGVAKDYIARLENPYLIDYWHPSVEPFLKRTNGIMVFQEQLMQVVEAIGNFSPAEADDMRKATGKLYRLGKEEAREFMQTYFAQWIKGTTENGIGFPDAEEIWQKILAFGGYSFNASHSVSYSLEGYQDAYLKANHPEEFYASIMAKDPDKAPQAVREALARGIKILPPDINESGESMTLSRKGIRTGLTNILSVGEVAGKEILEKRPFTDYADFIAKVNKRRCNARVCKGLVEAGAFDNYLLGEDCQERLDATPEERGEMEQRRLGFSLSVDSEVRKYIGIFNDAISLDSIESSQSGDAVIVGGEVIEVKEKVDRKGNLMCWVTLALGAESWQVTVFASNYPKYQSLIQMGNAMLARCFLDDRGGMTLNYACSPAEYQQMKETSGA